MERHAAELQITGGRGRARDGRKERRKGRRTQGEKTKSGRGRPWRGAMALWEEIGRDWSFKNKRELIKEKISDERKFFPLELRWGRCGQTRQIAVPVHIISLII